MWTFSNSTRKGQLKNVQDEISRPLGSREIQKTKVETVLRDTLYPITLLRKLLKLLDFSYLSVDKRFQEKNLKFFWGVPLFWPSKADH